MFHWVVMTFFLVRACLGGPLSMLIISGFIIYVN
jgi:hypothetical protein